MIFLACLLAGCAKLDSNMFNNDNSINEYLYDDYTGENDFILDETYHIDDSLIHEFTLSSKTPSEREPVTIYATYVGDLSTIDQDTVILYCHGNKWHMDFYWQRTKLLANVGGRSRFGVLTFDYRGYGRSEGVPTEDGMYADARAALDWLRGKGVESRKLIMYGFSLGSAPAVQLTAHPGLLRPSRLILEAPFASTKEMVRDASLLNMPASFFTTVEVDNAGKIKNVKCPFLWIHGVEDDFLSIKTHGEVVFRNYRGTGKAVRVVGANHGSIQTTMGFDAYRNVLLDFIMR